MRMLGTLSSIAVTSLALTLTGDPHPAAAAGAIAQDTVQVGVPAGALPQEPLPQQVADEVIAFYNRATTIRLSGRTQIPAGRELAGDVAILGGPVEIGGRIDGDLVVINGDLTLRPDARIEGELIVVGGGVDGGAVDGGAETRVGGALVIYPGVLRYRRTDEGIVYLGTERRMPPTSGTRLRLPDWSLGESEIYISGRPYNRIEGLPIAIGPRITTGGRNPLRIEALLVYRSEAGFDVDEKDLGYELSARQYLGGHQSLWAEIMLESVIRPIEDWQITNLENSLALFLFRQDNRDYYERRGFAGRVGWRMGRHYSGWLQYRDEDHSTIAARSPWTILFNTEDAFDPNAIVHGGDLRSITLSVAMDTRNDLDDPWAGWYNRLEIERSVGGRLAGREPDFTHFLLDLRRYNRVSPGAAVAFRFVTGGRAGGSFMPAQREHVLGGPGTLPGYDWRELDCGVTRDQLLNQIAAYGCQRFGLFQAEFRGDLDLRFDWGRDDEEDRSPDDIFSLRFEPDVVLFYDAGAAWNTGEGFLSHLSDADNWIADLGAGIELGGLGLYLAYPLAGSGGFDFIVRLAGRF